MLGVRSWARSFLHVISLNPNNHERQIGIILIIFVVDTVIGGSKVTFLKSHSWEVIKSEFSPRCLWTQHQQGQDGWTNRAHTHGPSFRLATSLPPGHNPKSSDKNSLSHVCATNPPGKETVFSKRRLSSDNTRPE